MEAFDECCSNATDNPYAAIADWLDDPDFSELAAKRDQANNLFVRRGITFQVYGDGTGTERLIPFDLIPRIIAAREWAHLSAGCTQRVKALNAFLHDIYHEQKIITEGVIPKWVVEGNSEFQPLMVGVDVPGQIYSHISGVDMVRTGPDDWYVLEDNLRCPSGVSYMLENRAAMRRVMARSFRHNDVEPIDHYPDLLLQSLRSCAPDGISNPSVVILTPGAGNSAYFEHAFLAQSMGVPLVEGIDLVVDSQGVWMHTTRGLAPVHVIYRRINDDYLDPQAFNPTSVLGVPGLFEAHKAGLVTISNAVGNGVADDKATYLWVPDMIRFYLGEEPILKNVPTWRCADPAQLEEVLDRLPELVVKEVHGAGGYGMLVGPSASQDEIEDFRAKLINDPGDFIAQPTLALSTCPTMIDAGIAPRHVDLRPYVLAGRDETHLVPGALTRVALKEGSLVVNSSQGGGTKDTWVLCEEGASC
ncbi:MAG: circularly permuted type 2 ATP-grasp protein [Planctomycetota bacterium]|jgi:uncharacterized circularly permuted ATP-grasp superfamily protein|nr:circularly permuted type 2 ATP-grasp protein [Planctomycetota bacterium]